MSREMLKMHPSGEEARSEQQQVCGGVFFSLPFLVSGSHMTVLRGCVCWCLGEQGGCLGLNPGLLPLGLAPEG